MANKFILVARKKEFDLYNPQVHIRLGNVTYHKDLTCEGEWVFGGGDFRFDKENKTVLLSGNSGDFGYPQFKRDFTKIYAEEDFSGWKFVYSDPFYSKDEIDLTPLMEFKDE